MKKTRLSDLVVDAGTQIRVGLDTATIQEYAEAYKAGKKLPPLEVFVSGKRRIVADGFHRFHAAQQAGLTELDCNLHEGSAVDALRFALGANTTHGLRRTNADKRNAAEIALKTWPEKSDRELAEICYISHPSVASVRKEIEGQLVNFTSSPTPPASPTTNEDPEPSQSPVPPTKTPEKSKPAPPPPPPKRIGKDGKARSLPKKAALKDSTGYEVPAGIVQQWNDALEFKGQIAALNTVLGCVERKGDNVMLCEVNILVIKTNIEQAMADLKRAIPYAVCATCHGEPAVKDNCTTCKGRGYVSEFFWKNCVDAETRKIREGTKE